MSEETESRWQIVPEETTTKVVSFQIDNPIKMHVQINHARCLDLWLDTDGTGESHHHLCCPDAFLWQLEEVLDKAHTYFGSEYSFDPISQERRAERIAEFQQQEDKAS